MNVIEKLKEHEGWRATPYRDSVGRLTVGYGFNLDAIEMPKPVGELWLSILVHEHEQELRKFHWYNNLDPNRQDVLLNLHYNLGHDRFMGFKRMIRALENEKYDEAAEEMLDSKWAGQVGKRATELASIMREG